VQWKKKYKTSENSISESKVFEIGQTERVSIRQISSESIIDHPKHENVIPKERLTDKKSIIGLVDTPLSVNEKLRTSFNIEQGSSFQIRSEPKKIVKDSEKSLSNSVWLIVLGLGIAVAAFGVFILLTGNSFGAVFTGLLLILLAILLFVVSMIINAAEYSKGKTDSGPQIVEENTPINLETKARNKKRAMIFFGFLVVAIITIIALFKTD
jgi:hypothetical protein